MDRRKTTIRPALTLCAVLVLTVTVTVAPLSRATVPPMSARGHGVSPTILVVRPPSLAPRRPAADQAMRAMAPAYRVSAHRAWNDGESGQPTRSSLAGSMPAPPKPLRARVYHRPRLAGAVLTLRSPSGPVGGSIGITGAGFAPGEAIGLLLDGHTVGVPRATEPYHVTAWSRSRYTPSPACTRLPPPAVAPIGAPRRPCASTT